MEKKPAYMPDKQKCLIELIEAAANGNDDAVAGLLQAGVPVNESCTDEASPFYGQNALCAALTASKLSTVQLLVEQGANPHQVLRFAGNVLMTPYNAFFLSCIAGTQKTPPAPETEAVRDWLIENGGRINNSNIEQTLRYAQTQLNPKPN